jgi:hypothetical protein
MERRKAMRFRIIIRLASGCRERNEDKVRLAALHAPRCFRGVTLKAHLAHGAGTNARGYLTIESGVRNDAGRFNTRDRHHRAGPGDPSSS